MSRNDSARVINTMPTVSLKEEKPVVPHIPGENLDFPLTGVNIKVNFNNCPPEIANALARVVACERPYYALHINPKHVHTDDMHLIIPELVSNILIMPLRHGLTEKDINETVMMLNIFNDTDEIMIVTMGDLSYKNHKPDPPIIYPNIQLIYLEPKKRLEILEIRIVKGTGLDHDGQNQATRFFPGGYHVCKPITIPTSTRRNFSQDESYMKQTCRDNTIEFGLKAICPGAKVLDDVMATSCREIKKRLTSLLTLVINKDAQAFSTLGEMSILISNETNTIAKMLDRITMDLFPDVHFVTTVVKYPDMNFEFKISDPDSYNMMINVFKHCIKIYDHLQSQFE